MRYFIFILCLFFILPTTTYLVVNPLPVHAETYIETRVTQNMQWTKLNSPYVISGDVHIPKGVIVEVEPGTVIKIDNGILDVEGGLYLRGSQNDKIIVTSFKDDLGGDTNEDLNNSLPSAQDYGGIFYRSGNAQVISNVTIRNLSKSIAAQQTNISFTNVKLDNTAQGFRFDKSKVTLNNARLNNILSYGITSFNQSSLAVSSTTVENSRGGINLYNQSTLSCDDCTFDVGDTGVFTDGINAYSNSIITLRDSTILYHGDGSALAVFNNDPTRQTEATVINTTITGGNQNGIMVYGSSILTLATSTVQNAQESGLMSFNGAMLTVTSNTFKNNKKGLELHGIVNGSISQSAIENNKEFGILSTTDRAFNAKDNWWGKDTGPGTEVLGNVIFEPWLTEDPFKKEICCSNILFLPGLQASRLYKPRVLTHGDQLWEPNIDLDMPSLFMDEYGQSKDPTIYTNDVIDEINISPFNRPTVYKKFMASMDDLVQKKIINDWQPAPYDWRLDYTDILQKNINLPDGTSYNLIDRVKSLALTSKSKRVTIVGHSNGGLLAKALLIELKKQNTDHLVDDVILVGTPQLGTPKALAALLHSDGQEYLNGFVMSKATARLLSENMASAYNLLPSQEYFDRTTTPLVIISTTTPIHVYGSEIRSYSALRDLLLAQKGDRKKPDYTELHLLNVANPVLLYRSETTHRELDSLQAPEYIKVHQIVGTGLTTLSGLQYKQYYEQTCALLKCTTITYPEHFPVFSEAGDGTVMALSAAAIHSAATYYFDFQKYHEIGGKGRAHLDMLEVPSIQQLITHIIQHSDEIPTFIASTSPALTQDMVRISIHSPVSIDMFDDVGHHLGMSTTTSPNPQFKIKDESIPGSSYLEFGEGKYISVPYNAATKLVLKGTDYGSATIQIDRVRDSQTVNHQEYKDIPVIPDMTSSITLGSQLASQQLPLDIDNNGSVDISINAGESPNPKLQKFLDKMDKHPNKGIFKKIQQILYNLKK